MPRPSARPRLASGGWRPRLVLVLVAMAVVEEEKERMMVMEVMRPAGLPK